jgi:hypothetical protein|tara:strand:+ start:814 stop:1035 length:222 start_codon:yes stop_codon:yes gene_type:complete
MNKLLKDIVVLLKEIYEVAKANNDLLGFICSKISPPGEITKESIKIDNQMLVSMEMSEMLDKYDAMPEEYGIS